MSDSRLSKCIKLRIGLDRDLVYKVMDLRTFQLIHRILFGTYDTIDDGNGDEIIETVVRRFFIFRMAFGGVGGTCTARVAALASTFNQ